MQKIAAYIICSGWWKSGLEEDRTAGAGAVKTKKIVNVFGFISISNHFSFVFFFFLLLWLKMVEKETIRNKRFVHKDYELTIFGIGDNYNGIFVCEKSDEFFGTYTFDKDEPALSSSHGTLSVFLSREEIYDHELAKSKKHKLKVEGNYLLVTQVVERIYIVNAIIFSLCFLF